MNLNISRDGEQIGVWTEEDVRAFYSAGQLLPTDLYWRDGMANWEELSTLINPASQPDSPESDHEIDAVVTKPEKPSTAGNSRKKDVLAFAITAVVIIVISAVLMVFLFFWS